MVKHAAMPMDAPLLVRHHASAGAPWLGLTIAMAVFAGVTLYGAIRVIRYMTLEAGVILAVLETVLAGAGWLGYLTWRSAKRAGPILAADESGLWMDFGSPRRPLVVNLAWSEVAAARLANWTDPAGRHIIFLCFDAPAAAQTLRSDATVSLRAHGAMRTFNTPFTISDRAKDVDVRTMALTVRRLAAAGGVDTTGIALL